jgi:hypothetical protein
MIRLKNILLEGNGPLKDQWLDKGTQLAKKLVSRGFTKEQASAIVGNMWAESTFNPAAKNSIGAIGLLQWLGYRKKALKKYANQHKKPWADLNLQLDFIKYELLDAYDGKYAYEQNQFNKAMNYGKTIQDKSAGFAIHSERPGGGELTDSLPTRKIAAHNVFSALTQKVPVGDPAKTALIGKTVYPLKKNGYVNVREESEVDSGWFNNLLTTIKYPNAVGTISKIVTAEDGKTWYQVKLTSGEVGYVRSDVVTTTNDALYTVQAGDTLTKISKNSGLSIDKIKQLNKLTSDTIKIGQKLKLY